VKTGAFLPPATDPVAVLGELIRRPSVTPVDAGALDLLEALLAPLGFVCRRLPFSEPGSETVDNLYARLGSEAPNFCFAGHTDVVPAGDVSAWTHPPFAAEIADGEMWGRGAADMKGGIACFIAAVARRLAAGEPFAGSVSLLITGDEEGTGVNGTKKVLEWLVENGERIDFCVVGEPSNPNGVGEAIKIGRRGSVNAKLTVRGTQGHVAYPHLADNPLPRLAKMLVALTETPLDAGTDHFQPSTLTLTTIDVGNPTVNLIPAVGTAGFNIRFNDAHTPESLIAEIRRRLDTVGGEYELTATVSGVSFVTAPGPLTDLVSNAVVRVVGRAPEFSTSGGTSDARFIKDVCPVVECGLTNRTMHKVDERVPLGDLAILTDIYGAILADATALTTP